jgi:hypothetical protein
MQQWYGGKGNFRRTGTQEICGRCKELAIARMRTTRRARVAWGRENFVRKDWGRNQAEQEIKKRRKDGKRLQKHPECNRGLRNVGLRQQLPDRKRIKDLGIRLPLYLKKKRTMNAIEGWSTGERLHLGSREAPSKNPDEIFGGKITKPVVEISCMLQRIRKRTLWRGRPPPKRKNRLHTE